MESKTDAFLDGLLRKRANTLQELNEIKNMNSSAQEIVYMKAFLTRAVAYYTKEIDYYSRALARKLKQQEKLNK